MPCTWFSVFVLLDANHRRRTVRCHIACRVMAQAWYYVALSSRPVEHPKSRSWSWEVNGKPLMTKNQIFLARHSCPRHHHGHQDSYLRVTCVQIMLALVPLLPPNEISARKLITPRQELSPIASATPYSRLSPGPHKNICIRLFCSHGGYNTLTIGLSRGCTCHGPWLPCRCRIHAPPDSYTSALSCYNIAALCRHATWPHLSPLLPRLTVAPSY